MGASRGNWGSHLNQGSDELEIFCNSMTDTTHFSGGSVNFNLVHESFASLGDTTHFRGWSFNFQPSRGRHEGHADTTHFRGWSVNFNLVEEDTRVTQIPPTSGGGASTST